MLNRRNLSLLMLATCVLGVSHSHAQSNLPPPPRPLTTGQNPPYVTPGTNYNTNPAPTSSGRMTVQSSDSSKQISGQPVGFVVRDVKPREPMTGWNAAVYGMANLAQGTTGANFSLNSEISGAGGIKLGYAWPFDKEPIDQFNEEFGDNRPRLGGGIELEAGYLNDQLKGSNAGGNLSGDIDNAYFLVNFLLKSRMGNFVPYIGGGVGGAYTSLSDPVIPGATGLDDDAVSFAYQGVAGLDYYFRPDWSVFTEFKYLVLQDLSLGDGGGGLDFGNYQHFLLGMGVRKTF